MIEVLMDSNEQTSNRPAAIKRAVESHDKLFVWKGFSEIPVDIRFIDYALKRYLSVELKEPGDLVASGLNGHLAKQVLTLQGAQEPGFIVCLGSVKNAYENIPRIVNGGYKTRKQLDQDFGRVRHFCAASAANGYPVFFWDKYAPELILAHAYSEINTDTLYEYLHKSSQDITEISMLCMIPGIGPTIAKGLYLKYGSMRKIMALDEEELSETIVNGRKIGKKASEIVKVFK